MAIVLFLVVLLAPSGASADPVTASITTALVSAGASKAVASFIASALVQAVGSAVLNGVSGALFGKSPSSNSSGGGFVAEARDRTQIIRSAVQPMNIVYGEPVISGPLAFADTPHRSTPPMGLIPRGIIDPNISL